MQKTQGNTAEELKTIEAAYQKLIESCKHPMSEEQRESLDIAYKMAVKAHEPQRRKSGEPYILHPIAVAQICAEEIGLGPTSMICALLHDTVEDTDISLEDIQENFGKRITMIVDGLTKFDNLFDVKSPQAENFKKILSTLAEDVRVVLVKMADRLHNMRTLGAMPHHKQLKIASETGYIYAPLAHRMGLYAIKTEYEDLVMKIKDPENYKFIARKLNETKRSRNRFIKSFIDPIQERCKSKGIGFENAGTDLWSAQIHSFYLE